jgi:hypothetical protein
MSYKECVGVLFDSMVIGFCLCVPLVLLLEIMVK